MKEKTKYIIGVIAAVLIVVWLFSIWQDTKQQRVDSDAAKQCRGEGYFDFARACDTSGFCTTYICITKDGNKTQPFAVH